MLRFMTGREYQITGFLFFFQALTLVTLVSEETVVFLQTLFIHAPCVACGWTGSGKELYGWNRWILIIKAGYAKT